MVKKDLVVLAICGLLAVPSTVLSAPPAVQPRQMQVKSVDPGSLPVEYSLVLGNPAGTKKLYVFTDPDCSYCRSLHAELKRLERIAPELAIFVMLFPLRMHPSAYDKARILVARQSGALLDDCFAGKKLPDPAGDEGRIAVEAIIRCARNNGISSTPTLVLPDGSLLTGIRSAETLKRLLYGDVAGK